MTRTLQDVKAEVLIQFGDNDPWIKPHHAAAFERRHSGRHRIEWLSDDHEMNAPASLLQRMAFITPCLGTPLATFSPASHASQPRAAIAARSHP